MGLFSFRYEKIWVYMSNDVDETPDCVENQAFLNNPIHI